MPFTDLKIRKRKGESFILEGPSSIKVISGRISSLNTFFPSGERVVIPEFKSLPFIVEEDCELEVKLVDESKFTSTSEYLPKDWVELAENLGNFNGRFKAVVLGDLDSGKSTLTTFLANKLLGEGRKVVVIDADTGQKDLGPPTTIGMKRLERPTPILSEEVEDSAFFVGSTSPAGMVDRSVAGVLLLVAEALKLGAEAILIDTTGWVYGWEARELKTIMISSLKPEFLIAIQRTDELETLLKPFTKTSTKIVRVSTPRNVRSRSRSERRALRSRVFRRYLRDGRRVTLSMDDVGILYSYLGSGKRIEQDRMGVICNVLGERPVYSEEGEDFIFLILDEGVFIEDADLFKLRKMEGNKEVKIVRKSDFSF